MPIRNFQDGFQTGTTHEGQVIRVEAVHYHVPSDNAMIDSGVRTEAKVWENGRVVTVALTSGRDSNTWSTGESDADEATAQKASDYSRLVAWIGSLRGAQYAHEKAQREAKKVRIGCRVQVVAGRKVKVGTQWYVHVTGSGNYGPYAHLSSEPNGMGDYVRYVNTENLQVIGLAEPELIYPDCPFGPVDSDIIGTALPLVDHLHLDGRSWAQDELDLRWRILLDAWTDSGFPVPDCVRMAALRQND